jgi:carbonic anhydrase/acetyltransferase-like protein (isoleucine patch superfamily)
VLHRAVVHTGALVAANATVLDDMVVPAGALAVGTPAKIKEGAVRPEIISDSAAHYVERLPQYARDLRRID